VFLDEVGEMESAREAGGACADDEDIGFELFTLDGHWLLSTILANRDSLSAHRSFANSSMDTPS
jgi:hypothetical protein